MKLPEKVRQAYAADRRATGENIYTLAPERFVLPDQVQARKGFKADLYRGHFERDGTVLVAGVLVEIARVTHFRKLEPSRAGQPRDEGLLSAGAAKPSWHTASPPRRTSTRSPRSIFRAARPRRRWRSASAASR